MLILQRKEGESLLIGDNVEISVLSVEAGREIGRESCRERVCLSV